MKIRIIFLVALLLSLPAAAQKKSKSNIFGSVNAREIGPAAMSGRISALDAVNADPFPDRDQFDAVEK